MGLQYEKFRRSAGEHRITSVFKSLPPLVEHEQPSQPEKLDAQPPSELSMSRAASMAVISYLSEISPKTGTPESN